ncbi:MAG: Ig-like domain-containing protein [Anaerolineales bacterium]
MKSYWLAKVMGLGLALGLALILMADVGVVVAESYSDGDIISVDQTLDGTWGPGTLTVTGDIVIQTGVSITVAEHTTILVVDGGGLRVEGDLHSDGPITFTTASSPPSPGAWDGVVFAPGSSGYLDGATIEYAVHGLTLDTATPITVSNSRIRYNRHATTTNQDAFGAGITIFQGDHLIEYTDIYSNSVSTTYSGADVYGGGLDIRAGNSRILHSRIYENSASMPVGSANSSHGAGGGIAIRAGGPLIQHCEVTSNTLYTRRQDYTYSGSGAGIGIYGNTQAEIRNNLIANNINTSRAASGGGIGFRAAVSAKIIDGNTIVGNAALTGGWYGEGGGIDDWGGSTFVASNNLIYNNTTSGEGGGIATWRANNARVFNNTIVGNTAYDGGGIYSHRGIYYNNIVVGNTATHRGGGVYRGGGTVDYNDIWNNTAPSSANWYGSIGAHNISVDPLFLGAGDLGERYHIQGSSPVIDAGVSSGTGLPADDYDGDPRPLYSGYDIGFDEVAPKLNVVKRAAPDAVRPGDVISYAVVISNTGQGDATGVVITDALSSNVQFVPGSLTLTPPSAGTVGSAPPTLVSNGAVAAGERITVTYAVTVTSLPTPVCVASIENRVEVASAQQIGADVTLLTPLDYSTTISGAQTTSDTWCPGTITVTGDVLIASGVVITVAPQTTLLVADVDGHNLGVDAARVEFIVENNAGFRINSPATFTSLASPAAPADWYGIRYLSGSHGWVDGATVEYGVHGLTLDTSNPITISNSAIRYNLHAPASGDAYGAGVHIIQGGHLISHTHIYSNTAQPTGNTRIRGAGVYIQGGSPRVINSWIYQNTAASANYEVYGGGIGINVGGALIEGCQILSNTITGGSGNRLRSGAGIGLIGNSTAIIRHNRIEANISNVVGYAAGAGIGFNTNARANLIDSNIIANNQATGLSYGEGGGIDAWQNNTFTAINNLIYNNLVQDLPGGGSYGAEGGGIFANGANTKYLNNTIVGNTARHGGGVARQDNSGDLYNNIVVGNHATAAGGGIYRSRGDAGTAGYNNVWGNTPDNYNSALVIPSTDMQVDPRFLGAGDLAVSYHLKEDSPMIDAGTNSVSGVPLWDYDGDARPIFLGWDVGFDEVAPDTSIPLVALKRAGVSPGAGGELAYTINLVNNGALEVSPVLTDVLPRHTVYSSGPICDLGMCHYDAGENAILWSGNVPTDSMLNLVYTVTIDAPLAEGTVITNAAILAIDDEITTTNVVTKVIHNPLFQLSKTRTSGAPVRGANVDYRITVRNNSSSGPATDVVITDVLPSGVNFVSAGQGGTLINGDTIRWTVANVPAGGLADLTFRIRTCLPSWRNDKYQVVTSTQHITSALGPAYNTNLAVPTINPAFDRYPFLLETLTTELEIDQTIYVTNTSTTNGGPIIAYAWDFGDGATATGATANHSYDTDGVFDITLTVTDTCGFSNSATRKVIVHSPSLTVAKQIEPARATPGQLLTYTVVISNTGDGAATGLTISDTTPVNTTYLGGSSELTLPVWDTITYRDELRARAYDGSDGTADWSSTPWVEANDNGTAQHPNSGELRVVTDLGDWSIRIRNANRALSRQMDLSGYDAARIYFEYRRNGLDNANDYVVFEASGDGGISWTSVFTMAGPTNDSVYQPVDFDLTPYIAADTIIRFRAASTLGGEQVYIDNVHIEAARRQVSVSPAGAPPTLGSGITLDTSETLTLTYNVTVDSAITHISDRITNTVAITTGQDMDATTIITTPLDLADVVISKTIDPSTAQPGDRVTYTIEFVNSGAFEASGVVITDTVPLTVTGPSFVSSGASVVPTAGSNFVWTVADLSPGTGGVITVTGVLSEGLPVGYVFTNTAAMATGAPEYLLDNNHSAISIAIVNAAPAAHDDATSTDEDTATTVDVLANDIDLNGDPLAVASVDTTGALGSVTNNTTDVTYDPGAAFQYLAVGESAEDVFAYTVADGHGGVDTAIVTITMTGLNDAPVAADDTATTDEDTPVAIDVLANDSDIDASDTLIINSIDTSGTQGTVTNNGGDVTYDPGAAFEYLGAGESALDLFTYTVTDGNGGSDNAVVTVTVTGANNAPVAVDDTAGADEDTVLVGAAPGVLANDSDPDGSDALVVDSYDALSAHGASVVVAADGGYSYDPTAVPTLQALAVGETLTDAFAYTISDGVLTDTAPVTVTVTGRNDAPVAADDTATTDEDTPVAIDVLANDSDIDASDTLIINSIDTSGTQGTVTNNGGDVTYDPGAAFEYLGAGESALDLFTYTVTDGNGGSDNAVVTVTVTGANNAPVAVDDTAGADEDTVLVGAAPGVLANDSDPDGSDALVVDSYDALSAHGASVVVAADGGYSYDPTAVPTLQALAVGETLTDAFAYTISDGVLTDTAPVTVTVTGRNDAPVAQDDLATTDEDQLVVIYVLANDVDPELEPLAISAITAPAHGMAINNVSSMVYIPHPDFNGEDAFIYTVRDIHGAMDTARVTVTVMPVNDDPVAQDDTAATDEDTPIAIDVLANDNDVDGDPLHIATVIQPAHGAVIHSSDLLTYTPNANFYGQDTFIYTVEDDDGASDMAMVVVTVLPVNDAPHAVMDTYSLDEGAALTVTADAGVLANDTDVEGDPLTATLISNVAHGVLDLQPDGSFTYTHNGSETTRDVFTYQATDGMDDSAVTTVTLHITPVNDAPVAAPDAYSVDEGQALVVAAADGVLRNDSDAEDDVLTAMLVDDVARGALALQADGSFTYTHDGSETTRDTFTYRASDGAALSNLVTVTLTIGPINDPPTVVSDRYYVAEGDTLTTDAATGVLANDSDPEGDLMTATLVSDVAHGALDLQSDGGFTYTHDGSETTRDHFTYQATDGRANSPVVTVTLAITPVNDAPTAAPNGYSLNEGALLVVSATTGVLANDSDVDSDVLTAVLATDVTHGILTLNADGSFTYAHDGSETTRDTFTYRASDGLAESNLATVTLTIAPVNDPPVAVDDAYTVDEGATLRVAATTGLLANDSDVDSDLLTATLVSDARHGALALSADGSFTYTHDGGETASDHFTYRASDGLAESNLATVTLAITPVNDPPVAMDDYYTTEEGGTLTVAAAQGVLANDVDVDNDLLIATLISDAARGALDLQADGSFTYTHDGGETETDHFVYRVSDGATWGNTATVYIDIDGVNDAPVAHPDEATTSEDALVIVDVLANDVDVDGDRLFVAAVAQPSHGTVVNYGGAVVYTPDADFNGADAFTYTASDGVLTATAMVSVTVTPVNDPPVAGDDAAATAEDTAIVIDVLANDTDIDGDPLSIMAVIQPARGAVIHSSERLTYTPTADFHGQDTFLYIASDGHDGTDLGIVMITVTSVNDPPVVDDIPDQSIPAGESFAAIALDAYVSDVDNADAELSWRWGGNVELDVSIVDRVATITPPDAEWVGRETLVFTATDPGGLAASDAATFTVQVGNRAPVAVADAYETPEDTPLVVAAPGVLANDEDADDDTLTAILEQAPAHGTVQLSADGSFVYIPTADFHGADAFTYRADDGRLASDIVTVSMVVTPVNDPPTISAIGDQSVLEGTATPPLPFTIADIDTPLEDLTLSAAASDTTLAPPGAFSFGGSGAARTVSIVPTPGLTGTARITITVDDGDAQASTSFNLQVEEFGPEEHSEKIYLPLIAQNFIPAPDLVVVSITATPDQIRVVIQNRGAQAVADNFWVDAYVDPHPIPQKPNDVWGFLCKEGLAWGVDGGLAPGEMLMLLVGDEHYSEEDSNFIGGLAEGTPIYAQVDSANIATAYGGVLESHEILGTAYNNIFGPVLVSSRGERRHLSPDTVAGSAIDVGALPARPRRR